MGKSFEKRSRLIKFLLIASSLLAFSAVRAQSPERELWENGISDPWYLPTAPGGEIDTLKSRWRAIEEELKTTGNEAAGTYRNGGEMRSGVLRWSPLNGFVYVYVYENFSVLDFSYGTVTITPSEIIFNVEREQATTEPADQPRVTPKQWIPARWKKSKYLIPVEDISDFGNYVAGFGAYNDFNGPCCGFIPFFVTEIKGNSQAMPEMPVLPKEYRDYLKQPIQATITRVGRKKHVEDYGTEGEIYSKLHLRATLTPVRISAGRRDGVKPNMLFRLEGEPEGQYLKITHVGLGSSEGVVVRDVEEGGKEECYYYLDSIKTVACPPITVGTRVTTQPYHL
ncbi:hypothetical protein BH18ACI2_BH18ACI2_12960 [soil metagenome]